MAALPTGSARMIGPSLENFCKAGPARTMATPIAIKIAAKPRLKASKMIMPNNRRLRVNEISRTAKASGQGISPPEIPSESRLLRPSAGAWECPCE